MSASPSGAASTRLSSLLLLLVFVPALLEAQTVRGTVLDEDTNAPVEGATVTLLEARDGQEAIAAAVTDGAGTFLLGAALAGRYRLHITRIGYAETTSAWEPATFWNGRISNG